MLTKLIKLANKLDSLGEHDLADELDAICREAVERNSEEVEEWKKKMLPHMQQMMSNPAEESIEEDVDESEPVPKERLNPLFPGAKSDIDPDNLTEEQLPDKYLETRVEDIEDFSDPDQDLLTDLLESKHSDPWQDADDKDSKKDKDDDEKDDKKDKDEEDDKDEDEKDDEDEKKDDDSMDGLWS